MNNQPKSTSKDLASKSAYRAPKRGLVRSLELALYKTTADLKAEAERTYLGVVWWVVDPLLSMAIYYLVFGVFLQRGTEDFVVFLLIGVVMWNWFASTVTNGQTSILRNKNLLQQAPLNKVIFPFIQVLTSLPKFAVGLIILFLFLRGYGMSVSIHYLALPALLFVQLCVIFAFVMPLSAVVPFFPDIGNLVTHLLRLGFYLSGIFFSPEIIPDSYRSIFFLNPLAVLIASYRDVLLYNQWPQMEVRLIVIMLVSLPFAAIGVALIRRFDSTYAKRIFK